MRINLHINDWNGQPISLFGCNFLVVLIICLPFKRAINDTIGQIFNAEHGQENKRERERKKQQQQQQNWAKAFEMIHIKMKIQSKTESKLFPVHDFIISDDSESSRWLTEHFFLALLLFFSSFHFFREENTFSQLNEFWWWSLHQFCARWAVGWASDWQLLTCRSNRFGF